MTKPQFTLIPSAYKVNKVYSVLPVDGSGDMTFSRGSEATRVRQDGLIENVLSNTPRLNWLNSNCPSLLLEGTSTNLQIRSEEFDNSAWDKTRITVTANDTISPDGTESADKVECNSTGSAFLTDAIGIGSTDDITFSTFIKSGNAQYCSVGFYDLSFGSSYRVVFDLHNEAITYELVQGSVFTNTSVSFEKYSNGWFRICTSALSTGTTNIRNYIYPVTNGSTSFTATQGQYNYIWGAQAELKKFCSSYIATTSEPVSRSQDICINGGDADLFDITEGTFFVDVTPFKASEFHRITLSNNTTNEEIIFLFYSNNTQVQIISESSGAGQVSYTTNITFDIQNKLAFTFKKNEFKFYVNGNLVHTDTSGNIATGLNSLHFAGNNGGFNYFQGKVHDTRVYNIVLTEAEAIKLTTI